MILQVLLLIMLAVAAVEFGEVVMKKLVVLEVLVAAEWALVVIWEEAEAKMN